MIEAIARLRGRHPLIVEVPVLSPRLSSYWLHLVTPVRASVARPLVEGLRTPTVVRETRIRELLPLELTPFEDAARAALDALAPRNFRGEGVHRAGRRSSTGDNPKGGTMKYMLLIHQGDAPTPRDARGLGAAVRGRAEAVYADYGAINQTPGVTSGPRSSGSPRRRRPCGSRTARR